MIYQINSTSSEATERFGEQIGAKLKGYETIELISDLGGGKTTFTRGLARGASSADLVTSPTFTINQIYKCPSFDINHLDFYRLTEPGVMADELAEFITDPKSVVVVEWGEIVADILPKERLTIKFTATGEHDRQMDLSCPGSLSYLLEK